MKPFATATVAILPLVAIVHLVRLFAGWSVSATPIFGEALNLIFGIS